MQPKIVPSSDKASAPVKLFESKINFDYRELDIGQSFQVDANEFKLGSVRMHAKRFMDKNPSFKLRVISHAEHGLIEVARVNVGTQGEQDVS